MIKECIVDRTLLRLIGKWLKVGVLEEGKRTCNVTGVPQGSVISHLLVNIYLHYSMKLSTFDFLGFTHYMGRSRRGGVKLGRKTIGKRMRRKLVVLNKELKRLRNALAFKDLYQHLCRILKGYYNYFVFAGNYATLNKFDYAVRRLWYKWLNRRSQRKSFNWKEFDVLLKRYPLPKPRIIKSYKWIYSASL